MAEDIKISKIMIDLLEKVVQLFKKYRIPYAVMGGVALQAWGRERSTKDIDITISLGEIGEEDLLQNLAKLGLEIIHSDKTIGQFGLIETQYTPAELGIPIGVDLFIARTEYQRGVLKRAIPVDVLGCRFKLVSPEDLIINKLLSARPLDLSDVQNLITEQKGSLDTKYLRHWARKLGVSKRLEVLLRENGY